MRGLYLLAVCMSALAVPAWAGWTRCPGDTADTGTSYAKPSKGGMVCLRQSTPADPARVNAGDCDTVTLIFHSDVLAAETYTATAYPYRCAGDGAANDFTGCKKIMVDRTGDGLNDDLPMNGDPSTNQDGTWDIEANWLAFDLGGTDDGDLELKVICK